MCAGAGSDLLSLAQGPNEAPPSLHIAGETLSCLVFIPQNTELESKKKARDCREGRRRPRESGVSSQGRGPRSPISPINADWAQSTSVSSRRPALGGQEEGEGCVFRGTVWGSAAGKAI